VNEKNEPVMTSDQLLSESLSPMSNVDLVQETLIQPNLPSNEIAEDLTTPHRVVLARKRLSEAAVRYYLDELKLNETSR